MWWKPTVKTCLTASVLHSLFPPLLCRYRLYDSSGVHRWILSAPPEGSAGDRQHALHHWRTVHGQPHRRRLQLLTAEWMEVRDTGKQNVLKHPTLGGNAETLFFLLLLLLLSVKKHIFLDDSLSSFISGFITSNIREKSFWLRRLFQMSTYARGQSLTFAERGRSACSPCVLLPLCIHPLPSLCLLSAATYILSCSHT